MTIITALESNNAQVKSNVADALGKTCSEKAVEPLIKLLDDEDDLIRFMSIVALGEIKSRKAVKPLFKLLRWENDGDNVVSIGKSLWNISGEECIEFFKECLTIEDADFRESTLVALMEIDNEIVSDILIKALNDVDDSVCNAAIEVIEEKDFKSMNVTNAVEPLINILRDKKRDSNLRKHAAYLLGKIKSEEAVYPLINLLDDNDSCIRIIVVSALGNIKSGTVIDFLSKALNDENIFVRLSAYKNTGKDIPVEMVESLVDMLKSDDHHLFETAAFELSKIKSERAVEGLIEAIWNKDVKFNYQIASELVNIKSEKKNELLLQLLESEITNINLYMIHLLKNLESPKVEYYLIGLLLDKNIDSFVRSNVINALADKGSEKSIELIFEHLNDEDLSIGWAAEEALKKLCSNAHEKLLKTHIESECISISNVAFEILLKIEKNERSTNQIFVNFI